MTKHKITSFLKNLQEEEAWVLFFGVILSFAAVLVLGLFLWSITYLMLGKAYG